MRPVFVAGLAVLALVAPASARGQNRETLVQQVREAELAFATTMARRDLAAFGTFLADETVFYGRQDIMRGKAAVIEGWRALFQGADAPFSWEPETVEVLESGRLGLTSGPVRDPSGRRVGTFTTVWRLEADGRWRVVFDKGCPPCNCAP